MARGSFPESVIKCMESMFRIHGLPETLRSDNGPLFASQEFQGFREYLATDHKKGIERLYKTLKSHQNSRAGRKRLETRVADFLTTPHTVTSLSPAQLLIWEEAERLTAVKRTSMRNALVPGPGRGNIPREILIETITETGMRQSIVERSSEIR